MEVILTDEFLGWFTALPQAQKRAVSRSLDLLEQAGPTLEHPHSSQLHGSKYALRELRIQAQGKPLRALYAFDPRRDAVVLVGGDKTGDERFYKRLIPIAERIWEQYLEEQRAGLHEED